ncbi:hypothetical protein KP509_29G028800, partial [Ceratopteris richardii]
MSSTGPKKGLLEVFKFGCYVFFPISMDGFFGNNPDNLEMIMHRKTYVVYPEESEPFPFPEEIREMIKKKRAIAAAA